MDPDNQVPGGLFATLQIQKPDELKVLANSRPSTASATVWRSPRSPSTERLSFAFLGIKDKYNQLPLGLVWADMWGYAITSRRRPRLRDIRRRGYYPTQSARKIS